MISRFQSNFDSAEPSSHDATPVRSARADRVSRTSHRPGVLLAIAAAVAIIATACGGSPSVDTTATASSPDDVESETVVEKGGDEVEELIRGDEAGDADVAIAEAAAPEALETGLSPFAAAIRPAGSAAGLDALEVGSDAPQPVSMDLPTIGVSNAPIDAVGVEPNGEMEIPGADAVGWYRYGRSPGDVGSAVLAAHIAYNGEDGVFRYLADLEPGDVFSVTYDDGSTQEFTAIGLRQYAKDEAPLDDFFDRSGTPRLVLITCGGDFNRALDSYDDNVVVVAVPTS